MKKAHLVGIKGVAMAALAVYLTESGFRVTGSDVADEFPTDEELVKNKIRIYTGFDGKRLEDIKPDVVYYTGAHGGRDNPEVQAALEAGIPALPHGKALGEHMKGSRQIVVSGSHGKTTTSAMIAVLLSHAGLVPSYAIGCGAINGLGAAGHKGKGTWFVAEGDEYVTDPGHDPTPRFMWLDPEILVVTNIDYDHPDAYPNLRAVQAAFAAIGKKAGEIIVNADDANSRMIISDFTYGFSPASAYRITHIGTGKERSFFSLEERGVSLGEFTIKVLGRHNVLNATSAMIAAHQAGVSWDELRKGILAFTGTKRRFEKIGERRGVTFIDDYAHHPTEIAATLAAARSWYPDRRIIVVFQPHTYSRTNALLTEFSKSFGDANLVLLTDIYASARESDTLGLTETTLVTETAKHHGNVYYTKDKQAVGRLLSKTLKVRDVVIFMGAGDIYNWGSEIYEFF